MGAQTDLASGPQQRQMAREGIRMRQERIRQRQRAGFKGTKLVKRPLSLAVVPPSSPVAQQEQDNAGSEFEQMLRRIRRG
jgi:hypothetical protein